ncbi:MAG: hypothetical protein M3393_05025 [Actinomycetota bacterium]|nr:hypothetical protein [Actinomycetota bacterium]
MDSLISVLVAAAGATWEARALQQLSAGASSMVLLKRCVDLNDLLATAATGQAQVALLASGLPGLDAECVDLLRRSGAGVVMIAAEAELDRGEGVHAHRLGLEQVLDESDLSSLREAIAAAAGETVPAKGAEPDDLSIVPETAGNQHGRTLAVWGPAGAPGRTTVAVGLAAELANRGYETFLVDVDGYGGSVAQHLGVLDEMSGLLGAARLANGGQLDHVRLVSLARQVDPQLRVLTGLPRSDRWSEVRDSAFAQVLETARNMGSHLVLDLGFSLEQDAHVPFGSMTPQRNAMTLAALDYADEVVVVGSADPVGLARLARGLVELMETAPGHPLRVVVNRSRPSLGWGEQEIRAMILGFVTSASVHFLPYDRIAADRALVSGKSLVAIGDSSLRRSLAELASAVTGTSARGGRRAPIRRRRTGRGR